MNRQLLKSKIHRAMVTESNRDYEGSITIDESLMDAAQVTRWEKVLVANIDTGARVETYAIPGPRGSGVICMNGGAAHYASRGEKVIIMSFASFSEDEISSHRPLIVKVDAKNQALASEAVQWPI